MGVVFPTAALEAEHGALAMRLSLLDWCNISEDVLESSNFVEEGECVGDVVFRGEETVEGEVSFRHVSCKVVSCMYVVWADE